MNELTVINQNGQLVVTSRQLAEDFEKEHAKVTRDIESLIEGIAKNGDTYNHLFIDSQYQNDQNKQWYKEYLLTRDGFTLLAMGFTGEKALRWKLKYIEAFNNMEKKLQSPVKIDSKFLFQIATQLEEKEKQIQIMAPKAEYFDDLVDRNLLTNIRDTAKELKVPEGKFVDWLLDNGYLYRDQKRKLNAYGKHIPKLFEVKEWTNSVKSGNQTLITPRGRETFRLLLKKDGLIREAN